MARKFNIKYYQNKINKYYGKNKFKVISLFHNKNHQKYMNIYNIKRNLKYPKKTTLWKHLKGFKITLNITQQETDNVYGKNKYKILKIGTKNRQRVMYAEHLTPACGYHISFVNYESFLVKKSGCHWCGTGANGCNRKWNYALFLVGKLGNGQYTLLSTKKVSGGTYLLLRHNNQSCNYYTWWISIDKFRKGRRCKKCERTKQSNRLLKSQSKFLKEVFSREDNKNLEYIPAQRYKGASTPILFWHMTLPVPHLFYCRPTSFIYNWEKCTVCQTSPMTEQFVYGWLKKHSLLMSKDVIHGYIFNKGILQGLHIDFLLKKYNIGIEVEGQQHKVPWSHSKSQYAIQSLKDVQYHDYLKTKYCKNYGIKLIHIVCYHHTKTNRIASLEGKPLIRFINKQMNSKILPLLKI